MSLYCDPKTVLDVYPGQDGCYPGDPRFPVAFRSSDGNRVLWESLRSVDVDVDSGKDVAGEYAETIKRLDEQNKAACLAKVVLLSTGASQHAPTQSLKIPLRAADDNKADSMTVALRGGNGTEVWRINARWPIYPVDLEIKRRALRDESSGSNEKAPLTNSKFVTSGEIADDWRQFLHSRVRVQCDGRSVSTGRTMDLDPSVLLISATAAALHVDEGFPVLKDGLVISDSNTRVCARLFFWVLCLDK